MQLLPLRTRQYVLYWYIAETLPPSAEIELATAAPGMAYKMPPPFPADLSLRERIGQEPVGYEPVRHEGTGVNEEERAYGSELLGVEEAMEKLGVGSVSADVVRRGWMAIQERFTLEDSVKG